MTWTCGQCHKELTMLSSSPNNEAKDREMKKPEKSPQLRRFPSSASSQRLDKSDAEKARIAFKYFYDILQNHDGNEFNSGSVTRLPWNNKDRKMEHKEKFTSYGLLTYLCKDALHHHLTSLSNFNAEANNRTKNLCLNCLHGLLEVLHKEEQTLPNNLRHVFSSLNIPSAGKETSSTLTNVSLFSSTNNFAKNIMKLRNDINNLEAELIKCIEVKEVLSAEDRNLNEAENNLAIQIEQHALEVDVYEHNLLISQQGLRQSKRNVTRAKKTLKQMHGVYGYNHLFFIWFEDRFGTINNSRLGFSFNMSLRISGTDSTLNSASISNEPSRSDLRAKNSTPNPDEWTDIDTNPNLSDKEGEALSISAQSQPSTSASAHGTRVKYFKFRSDESSKLINTRNSKPSWKEISVAFGWVLLLLDALAAGSKHRFKYFKLFSKGEASTIQSTLTNATHKLHFKDTLIQDEEVVALRKVEDFCLGIVGIIECMAELAELALQHDASLNEKYKLKSNLYPVTIPINFAQRWIEANRNVVDAKSRKFSTSQRTLVEEVKIGGYRVDVAGFLLSLSESDRREKAKEWTDAMYCLLSNLKWLQLWVSQTQ